MRRQVRTLLLLICPLGAGLAQAAPRARTLEPVSETHAPDRACPIQQPELKKTTLRSHRVARGDSLSALAYRYGTSARALAAANGLKPDERLRADQVLIIPQRSRPGGGDDWLKYARPPKEPGKLDLYTYTSRFTGAVLAEGRVLPSARSAISALLGVKGTRPVLSERLIRLMVRVSDAFGGRPVRVVSGYRASSYFADSRHRRSEAVDFSIPGVPNVVVRQYLLLLDDVGVGYYPNSSFLHLDVRACPLQWTDYAGPGEAPRRSPRRAPRIRRVAKAEPASD
jgi:LysM repeat protein